MSPISFLQARQSTPSRLMRGPGPSDADLQQLLSTAMRVPDHGQLAPWRFLLIQNAARTRLSDALVARKRELEPMLGDEAMEKERMRFLYAPSIVVVIACTIENHKIPVCEQLMSAGAVCMQLLNAAHTAGFASQWLTGWAAYDPEIQQFLGLGPGESITGFIHLGHSDSQAVPRSRPALDDKLRRL